MAGQKRKRRRPPGKYGHRRRGALAVASVITLAILLSCCRAVDADNSNINSGRQSGDLLSDNITVESEDRVGRPRAPEVIPVEVLSEVDTKNDDGRGREKEEEEEEAAVLLPPSVATSSNVATDETEEDDITMSSGAASPGERAGPAEAGPAEAVDTAVEDSTAVPAQLKEDDAVGGGVLRDPARTAITASAAPGAIPPFADSTDVDLDDLAESDPVVATDTAHADVNDGAAAVAAEGPEPSSLQHDMSAVAVDGDDGVGEGLHVSQPLNVVGEETSEAEAEALATGADTPADQARHGDGQKHAAAGENREQEEGEEEEEGGEREEIGQPERMGEPLGEEIEDNMDLMSVPPAVNNRGETAGVVEIGADDSENDEVVGSIPAELSMSAIVADDVDDGEDDLDGADVAADTADADVIPGVGPGDGTDAAASAITQDEQQRWQSPSPPPEASTGSETDLLLDAQASATGVVESDDPGKARASMLAAGNGLKEDEATRGVSNTGGAIDVAVTAEPSPPSDVAGPRTPSTTAAAAAAAAKDNQQSAGPRGGPSLSTDTTTAAVADDSDLLPRQVVGESRIGGDDGGGGGGVGGDREAGDGGGHGKVRGAAGRPLAGSGKAGSQSKSSGEEIGAPSSNHSSSGSRRGGTNDAERRQRYGGGRERGQEEGIRSDHEEKIRGKGPDGVGGGGDAKGDGNGGADGGADFSRGSPEELAQRVRDMEAELVRKLLAEEDAKSLLDIWVEQAREYVLTQTVPPTDAECDFSWSRLRCEPKCTCGARLRFGDYTPGRACRLLHPWERRPELCGGAADGEGAGGAGDGGGSGAVWDPSDEPAVKRVLAKTMSVLGRLRRAYEARIAPPSDPECGFSLETRRCEPHSLCRLRLQWGDLSLNRACRLATVPEKRK